MDKFTFVNEIVCLNLRHFPHIMSCQAVDIPVTAGKIIRFGTLRPRNTYNIPIL